MSNLPKISVIIPCYNVCEYIERCLESVLNQTYKNIEVILIDDGSTDNTDVVISKLIDNKKNIIFIRNENSGVSNARNTGLKHSSGEYLMFIDSDDYIAKNMIENMYKLMCKYSSDIVKCNIKKDYVLNNIKEDAKPLYSRVRDIEKSKFSNTIYKKILSTETMNSVCCALFKANIIKENNMYFREDIHNGEDAIFFMNYIDNCKDIVYTPAAYYNYVIRNTGLTGTGLSMELLWDSKLKFIEELKSKEKQWDLTKYKYVDKKIIYIVVSCIVRLYKKDKSGNSEYKKEFLLKMITDVNLVNILTLVNYSKLNFTQDRIDILNSIKENKIDEAIRIIESI